MISQIHSNMTHFTQIYSNTVEYPAEQAHHAAMKYFVITYSLEGLSKLDAKDAKTILASTVQNIDAGAAKPREGVYIVKTKDWLPGDIWCDCSICGAIDVNVMECSVGTYDMNKK